MCEDRCIVKLKALYSLWKLTHADTTERNILQNVNDGVYDLTNGGIPTEQKRGKKNRIILPCDSLDYYNVLQNMNDSVMLD